MAKRIPLAKRTPKKRTGKEHDPNSDRAIRFCELYVAGDGTGSGAMNGALAAVQAGYAKRSAKQTAYILLGLAPVQERIQALMDERSVRTQITADKVLEQLYAIATADPRELVEYRRTCCRYCWGANHDHQRTAREITNERALWERRKEKKPDDVFDLKGGDGYDARKAPHSGCPECFGEGRQAVYVHDTRALSPSARRLYAGVKTTKDGIEVKMRDQDAALVNLGRHLKLFTDVVKHEGLEELADDLRQARERVKRR